MTGHQAAYSYPFYDPFLHRVVPQEEFLARIMARRTFADNEFGFRWEYFIPAARAVIDEFPVMIYGLAGTHQ